MQKYDYIIAGTGAAGLLLAYRMATDSFFDKKLILLIDRDAKNKNDRTWCFWEKGTDEFDQMLHKKWSQIYFGSDHFSSTIDISPYQYKMIRGEDFYQFVLGVLDKKSNITRIQENVIGYIDEGSIVELETDKGFYLGDKVFSSILQNETYKSQKKYPLLKQHFIGWFIKTKTAQFDSATATFMDFEVEQRGNTRFMYILPFSETEALFEYTLFSQQLLPDQEYEDEIEKYLKEKGIAEYQITEKEKGCIPMTSYRFNKHNSKNVLHIGTAGGWTKASTGFTFKNTQKNTKKLISYLKNDQDLSKFDKKTKFWYYDLLFLDVLHQRNEMGAFLFSELFRKNKTEKILKFLDEETSFLEDLKIMSTMPSGKFSQMILKRLFQSRIQNSEL